MKKQILSVLWVGFWAATGYTKPVVDTIVDSAELIVFQRARLVYLSEYFQDLKDKVQVALIAIDKVEASNDYKICEQNKLVAACERAQNALVKSQKKQISYKQAMEQLKVTVGELDALVQEYFNDARADQSKRLWKNSHREMLLALQKKAISVDKFYENTGKAQKILCILKPERCTSSNLKLLKETRKGELWVYSRLVEIFAGAAKY